VKAKHLISHFNRISDAPNAVPRLRQLILGLAVHGRLVEQDPEEEHAAELLARIAKERKTLLGSGYPNSNEAKTQLRKQRGEQAPADLRALPDGWEWATLMSCCAVVVDCHNKTAPYSSSGIPLIRTSNVRDGELILDDCRFVEPLIYERWSARCPPEPGDILITREAPMGEVCIIPPGMKVCLGQRMMLARLVPDTIDPEFMLYSLRDPLLLNRVQDKPVGATVQHLRVGGVESLLIPVAPLGEQRRIVAKVDQLMALCDELEEAQERRERVRDRLARVAQRQFVEASPSDDAAFHSSAKFYIERTDRLVSKNEHVFELRRTILDLAVRGRLLPQESTDESTETLLEKISREKSEMVAAGTIKKPKPSTPVSATDVPFQLPSSWKWVRLSDITSYIQRGKSPRYAQEKGIPVVSQKCVQWSGLQLQHAKLITAESLQAYEAVRFLRDGDLLWNSTGTGTIGRIIRVSDPPGDLVCDSHVTVVRCLEVEPDYVRYWLSSDHVYLRIEQRASGATNQVELTQKMATEQLVPLPPIAEQRRIVAKVSELMTVCKELATRLDETQVARARLLEAVLREALSEAA
jgi:type I restriction enzyme, S subunit